MNALAESRLEAVFRERPNLTPDQVADAARIYGIPMHEVEGMIHFYEVLQFERKDQIRRRLHP
jgi:NADH:ubiquinone oxidoreductase subunit E